MVFKFILYFWCKFSYCESCNENIGVKIFCIKNASRLSVPSSGQKKCLTKLRNHNNQTSTSQTFLNVRFRRITFFMINILIFMWELCLIFLIWYFKIWKNVLVANILRCWYLEEMIANFQALNGLKILCNIDLQYK